MTGTGPLKIHGLHHIGVLVRNARVAAERLHLLGLEVSSWEDYGPGLLRIGFIRLGGVLLELIEPLTADGFNAEWLRRCGEGIQHIALHVDDIHAAIAFLKERGVSLQDKTPREGAGNTMIAFLAPADGGFLIELTQPRDGGG
jgi:methylmalonyl-CoA epimerase